MKIVLIHGQNHIGTTCNMGRMLAVKLTDKSNITEFFLPRDLPHFCLGCYACIEDETKCPYWEDKKRILSAMQMADLFIFTTPNYCLAPSAAMKNLLDLFFDLWMVHRPKDWMFYKKAVVLSASAGAFCKKVIDPVKTSLFYWGVPCVKTFGMPVHAMNWEMVNSDKKSKMDRKLQKIATSLQKKKTVRAGFKTKAIFNCMRMLHKKGWDSSPVEQKYWEEKGWLNKHRPWKE